MKHTFSNAWISLLVYGAIAAALAVEPAAAASFARRGAFNNVAAARRAADASTASMLAASRANNAAPTPAQQLLNQSHANSGTGPGAVAP
jgi:hypothetical protein